MGTIKNKLFHYRVYDAQRLSNLFLRHRARPTHLEKRAPNHTKEGSRWNINVIRARLVAISIFEMSISWPFCKDQGSGWKCLGYLRHLGSF